MKTSAGQTFIVSAVLPHRPELTALHRPFALHRRVHFFRCECHSSGVCYLLESNQPSRLMQSKYVVTQQMLETDAGKTAASNDDDIKSELHCSRKCPTPGGGALGCQFHMLQSSGLKHIY